MKLRRSRRLPYDLRRVQAALGKLHRRPAAKLDLQQARQGLRELVKALAEDRDDAEITAEIDAYVDDLLAGWRSAAWRRHRAVLAELDRLQVPVAQVVDRIGTLDHDDEHQQRDMAGAVRNILDQIVDEDAPYRHPLPGRRTEG
ncbi:hypothetical protein [Micromonospora rifamycinica]|uniref:Uncharacterized protein n=1 Tax=Micromonospora rifamycinica TaxID=291594 RepID=A0A109IMP5_9ACTN|nr:hypothetical protein [Micromonospora rifamycinica]KWV33357.1 hypothetical protein AWV63_07450 [Micromonospora rifamycinica]SCG74374.1 hypothetical protein GA0070623_3881 [Micromonospora rifamycinica]